MFINVLPYIAVILDIDSYINFRIEKFFVAADEILVEDIIILSLSKIL